MLPLYLTYHGKNGIHTMWHCHCILVTMVKYHLCIYHGKVLTLHLSYHVKVLSLHFSYMVKYCLYILVMMVKLCYHGKALSLHLSYHGKVLSLYLSYYGKLLPLHLSYYNGKYQGYTPHSASSIQSKYGHY